eukprot:IDg13135t1
MESCVSLMPRSQLGCNPLLLLTERIWGQTCFIVVAFVREHFVSGCECMFQIVPKDAKIRVRAARPRTVDPHNEP